MTHSRGGKRIPRHIRVAAVAQYLIGTKLEVISHIYGVSNPSLIKWVRQAGCFKLRNRKLKEDSIGIQP